ncbi:MAG TPA: LysM peptidoglycan-binding domain-containing protein [Bacillota bacterium]|nr:LysM peptidoglycan-binding domain-containing protein [Bacillota bacterium]
MKKWVIILATSIIVAGATAVKVSAEEYEVEKGDSLWKIAQQYDTTVNELQQINDLSSTTIQPKQKLTIYETYIVEKGDTLTDIAKKFSVTVDELKEWNDLQSDLIAIDQELEIRGSKDKPSDEKAEAIDNKSETTSSKKPEGQTMRMTATAYTASCSGCTGVTYTGVDLNANPDAKVIAVDPDVIPLGSEVYVEGYGYATAADIGGAINGNKIDLYVPTKEEANDWGVRTVDVTIIE